MPKEDFDAGREAGILEGRRKAAVARRWTDFLLLLSIVAGVVVLLQVQTHRQAEQLARTNVQLYESCIFRNKVLARQVKFYLDDANTERTNRFIDQVMRTERVRNRLSIARDIEALGTRDCTVFQTLQK